MSKLYIYCDDTGISANATSFEPLANADKIYTGVLIPQSKKAGIEQFVNAMSQILNSRCGETEFHFTDIYAGRKGFTSLTESDKLQIFELFTSMFLEQDLKWFSATYSNETSSKINEVMEVVKAGIKELNKQAKKDNPDTAKTIKTPNVNKDVFTLVNLCRQISKHLQNTNKKFKEIEIVCDEGVYSSGHTIDFSNIFKNVADSATLKFDSSQSNPLLQVADFNAYSFFRMQQSIKKVSENLHNTDGFYLKMHDMFQALTKNCLSEAVKFIKIKNGDSIENINQKATNIFNNLKK